MTSETTEPAAAAPLDLLLTDAALVRAKRACCTVHSPVGLAVTPPRCIRRVPCSSLQQHGVCVQEVDREHTGSLEMKELPPGRA